MINAEGDNVDLYIPRKCSWTNRLIEAKDHASVQVNVGHLDQSGVYNGQYTTFALSGFVRCMVRTHTFTRHPRGAHASGSDPSVGSPRACRWPRRRHFSRGRLGFSPLATRGGFRVPNARLASSPGANSTADRRFPLSPLTRRASSG